MNPTRTLALLSLLFSATLAVKESRHSSIRGSHEEVVKNDEDEIMQTQRHPDRALKGGGFSLDVDGLVERGDCAPLSGVEAQRANSNSDSECQQEGGCSGGCCRIYNWLMCDTSNGMYNMQCVCNANTRPRGEYTGFTITNNGLTSNWDGPGAPLPEALAATGATGTGGFTGGTGKKGGGKKSGKKGGGKSVGAGQGGVLSQAQAASSPVYVSPNGATATIQVTPANPQPANPPGPAPAPGPGNTGGTGSGSFSGAGTNNNNNNNNNGNVPIPQVAEDVCENGSRFSDNPAFANFIQCTGLSPEENGGEPECNESIGECCLAEYCMCGKPGPEVARRCVPPYDYNTIKNNQL